MFPGVSPSAVPDVLRCLQEYAELQQELQARQQQNCQPSLELRIRLKLCESHLPANLLSYFHRLTNHPPPGCISPLSILTTDGYCRNCAVLIPTAWLHPVRQQTTLHVCEICGAILIPTNLPTVEVCDAK